MLTICNRHSQQKRERVETDINPSMVHHQFALQIRRINIRLYSVTFSVSSLRDESKSAILLIPLTPKTFLSNLQNHLTTSKSRHRPVSCQCSPSLPRHTPVSCQCSPSLPRHRPVSCQCSPSRLEIDLSLVNNSHLCPDIDLSLANNSHLRLDIDLSLAFIGISLLFGDEGLVKFQKGVIDLLSS